MLNKSKKGMQWLTGVAYAIVALVMIVGIGLVVLGKLADGVSCGTGYTYNDTGVGYCSNATASVDTNAAGTSLNYGADQLGSTGLLSWLPAIIALVIGLFFLASFMGKRKEY